MNSGLAKQKSATNTVDFLQQIFELQPVRDELLFYRGHPDCTYKLLPSVLRSPALKKEEHRLASDLIASSPEAFAKDTCTLDRLARMQHYSLPTRLLDITSNPLIALYFACSKDEKSDGEVIVFRLRKTQIKFFDSDTASILANISRLTWAGKAALRTALTGKTLNQAAIARKLLHFVAQEKPYFDARMKPKDFDRILLVKAKNDNGRIISQAGLFFLFGLNATFDKAINRGIAAEKFLISSSHKSSLLGELDRININESTVFTDIESSARYLTSRVKS